MWHYAVLKVEGGFVVCENFPGLGHTGEIAPFGETKEELVNTLRMMLADLEAGLEV